MVTSVARLFACHSGPGHLRNSSLNHHQQGAKIDCAVLWRCKYIPGPPKEPKIMAKYPKIESIGSIGSIILAILEVQIDTSNSKGSKYVHTTYFALSGAPGDDARHIAGVPKRKWKRFVVRRGPSRAYLQAVPQPRISGNWSSTSQRVQLPKFRGLRSQIQLYAHRGFSDLVPSYFPSHSRT